MSSASEYTAYHMKCINFFKWTCLSRSYIKELSPGFYKVFPSPIVCRLMHFIYFVNLLFKQIFLLLLITGHLGPTEFLDTICGLDYFLCGVMVFISYIIWQRYPLYGKRICYRTKASCKFKTFKRNPLYVNVIVCLLMFFRDHLPSLGGREPNLS